MISIDTGTLIDFGPLRLLCVRSETGTNGAEESFNRLENKLESLKGMKFYGLSREIGGSTEYLACFEADAYESIEGLEEISLPGGKYARYRLKNWEERSESIGEIFSNMTKHNKAEKN